MAKISYVVTLDVEPIDSASQVSAQQLPAAVGAGLRRYVPEYLMVRDAIGRPHTYRVLDSEVQES